MCEEQQQPFDQRLIQRFRSHRDFTHREFNILIVDMHMYSEPLDSLDSRYAPFPSFSPFRLHNGPCDRLSCDCHHTSRRGFGVLHFLMSRVSHLSNPRLPMRPFPHASPAGHRPWLHKTVNT
jgi:hypothetical protein